MRNALLMTWYNSNNYGTLLQSYATKEIFKDRYGVECYFVNYVPKGKRDLASVIRKFFTVGTYKRQFNIKYDSYMLRKHGIEPYIRKRLRWVEEFVSGYKYALDSREIKTEDDFKALADDFDLYISGSDQI